jgi:rare lipoprotein A
VIKLALPGLLAVLLSACGGGGSQTTQSRYHINQDTGPDGPIDLRHVQDAVPKPEPHSRYGNPKSYVVLGKRYYVKESSLGYKETGTASWYGKKFHGHRTSSGEPYDMYKMTAAHKTLPLPTYVKVRNLNNGRTAIVKVNDRGPFHQGRIIDLSYAAAHKLGYTGKGTARVEIIAIDTRRQVPPTRTDVKPPSTTHIKQLYIQAGAFTTRNNAIAFADKLRTIQQQLVRIVHSAENNIYRVQIGPLDTQQQAISLVETLESKGIANSQIIRR